LAKIFLYSVIEFLNGIEILTQKRYNGYMAEKERIYLTDITLHTREYHQTLNYAKAAKKGRMYAPLPAGEAKSLTTGAKIGKIVIPFPPDLQERISRGEVEIMMPKEGLFVYVGKDVVEKVKGMNAQANRQDVHNKWGKKNWLDGKKGV
jgi:hypothetical protein